MFNKSELQDFRNDVNALLKQLEGKYNTSIHAGKISYSENEFKLTVEVKKNSVGDKSFEQAEFERLSILFGFSKDDYMKQFENLGKKFYLCGFNTKAKSMPVIAMDDSGKKYKFSLVVQKYLL